MTQPFRLPRGGRIDRSRPVCFSFNGRSIDGYHGDTAASALLANGIHLMGRSFKYHRPRGVLSAGSEEPNALFDVDRGGGRREPNMRATGIEVFEGLALRSQNHWPSLEHDAGVITDKLGSFLSAGFYYKTFLSPTLWTKLYEPIIRRAAGLGVAPTGSDPERYTQRHAHCEVLIVGAGPAGMAAALAASEIVDQRVFLVDEQNELGGTLLHDVTSTTDGKPTAEWLADAIDTLSTRPNVTILPRTTAFGYYNQNHVCLAERIADHLAKPGPHLPRERLWQVRAGRVILATGAHERPLVFADNDRPGIMLADSVRTYINRYAVAPGRRIVIATSADSAYRAAFDAKAAGLGVTLVDVRREPAIGATLAEARAANIDILTSHTVIAAAGSKRVTGLVVAPVDADGRIGPERTLDCDCVGMSGGWTPAVHLFSQSRGKLAFGAEADAFLPARSVQAEQSVGSCNGSYHLAQCLAEGAKAGGQERAFDCSTTYAGFTPVRALPTTRDAARTKAFVDFQNDVTAKDIKLAVQEGFRSIEHVKRYTTTGMATDQGKTSNLNTLAIAAEEMKTKIPTVGLTTFRPPYTPVSFGAFAGANRGTLFDPVRATPMHALAVSAGAEFEDVGTWKRAWYFPRDGEDMQAAVARECTAVRSTAGIFDASTLGKIEVTGPDACEFLDRLYTGTMSKLGVGRCRYGLMLKEDGYIFDDGVVARLSPTSYHVTTTTGGAARVLSHMEDYLQTEWPHLRVFLTSITEQWAVIAVQGPKAREIIAPLVGGIDLSTIAVPHLSVRTGHFVGVPCRLMRMSFTGEAGYEINVPSDYGPDVWRIISERCAPIGLTPYGTEAMHVLRAEKGYIIVGQETDGTMTPDDVGLGGLVAKSKRDFVGKRSLARPDLVAPGRKQLVGLLTTSPFELLDVGAQIVETPNHPVPMRMLGHVTSSYFSTALGRTIALAVVADGRARTGQTLHVTTPSGFTTAAVTSPVFIDAEGARLHA